MKERAEGLLNRFLPGLNSNTTPHGPDIRCAGAVLETFRLRRVSVKMPSRVWLVDRNTRVGRHANRSL